MSSPTYPQNPPAGVCVPGIWYDKQDQNEPASTLQFVISSTAATWDTSGAASYLTFPPSTNVVQVSTQIPGAGGQVMPGGGSNIYAFTIWPITWASYGELTYADTFCLQDVISGTVVNTCTSVGYAGGGEDCTASGWATFTILPAAGSTKSAGSVYWNDPVTLVSGATSLTGFILPFANSPPGVGWGVNASASSGSGTLFNPQYATCNYGTVTALGGYCVQSSACLAQNPLAPICYTTFGQNGNDVAQPNYQCVQCLVDTDCKNPVLVNAGVGPICSSDFQCIVCNTTDHPCPQGQTCSQNACVQCVYGGSPDQCPTGVCNQEGICTGCSENNQCPLATQPICQGNTCVACNTNPANGSLVPCPSGYQCQQDGSCVPQNPTTPNQCTNNDGCLNGTVCITGTGTCNVLPAPPTTGGTCAVWGAAPGDQSGAIWLTTPNTAAGQCCLDAQCPTGQTCTGNDVTGAFGQCTSPVPYALYAGLAVGGLVLLGVAWWLWRRSRPAAAKN